MLRAELARKLPPKATAPDINTRAGSRLLRNANSMGKLSRMLRTYWHCFKYLAQNAWRSPGRFPRECALCGYFGKFLGYGYPFVCDSLCPKCGSLESHRLLALANRDYDFFSDRKILHVAPDSQIRELVLAHQPRSYMTTDLSSAGVDHKENIEALAIEEHAFDMVICLHVLEHVNDRKAVGELFRVLKPGGILLAMFPIVEGWDETFEEPPGSTTEERLLYFNQRSRARFFGRDARERLAAPGFIVEEYTAIEPNVSRYGLTRGEKVFICSRPTMRRNTAMEHAVRAGIANGIDMRLPLHSPSS
jgi:SAM-dependent methyltransferase